MGGCRCSYRNCTVKSDKKTHMFHFPVFEKLRCYKWIINSLRYDFLDLTVSQLRNRVVCQHHFKDECFMNYKKEKLIFDVVPTEDGPYCDSSKETNVNRKAAEKAYLLLNNIEPDSSYIDKKATLSLKYINFLLNMDVSEGKTDMWIDIPIKQEKCESHVRSVKPLISNNNNLKDKKQPNVNRNLFCSPTTFSKELSCPQQIDQVIELQPKELDSLNMFSKKEPTIIFNSNKIQEINNISMEPIQVIENVDHYQPPLIVPLNQGQFTDFNSSNLIYFSNNEQCQLSTTNKINDINSTVNNTQNSVQSHNNNERVKILSEKTIYEPLPLSIGQFVPVLPSLVLQVPNRMKQRQNDNQIIQTSMLSKEIESIEADLKPSYCGNETFEDLKNNDIVIKVPPKIDILEIESSTQKHSSSKQNNNVEVPVEKLQESILESKEDDFKPIPKLQSKNTESVTKLSLLKNKVSPERLAAIEKKRLFNKRLRDIVESCLEKPDDREEVLNRSNVLTIKDTENVDTYLSKDNVSSRSQDYALTYLEARMQKMENVLLKKIEQNSNRIADLKNCIAPHKRSSVYTQTPNSDHAYKIYLYEEISKFLSSKAKDLIYEELFIYKYADNVADQQLKPKRKRHR